MSNNQNQRPEDEMTEQAKNAGKQVGNKAKQAGKNVAKKAVKTATKPAKKAVKKIAAKLGKKALMLAAKGLMKLGMALLKGIMAILSTIGLPVLVVLAIVVVLIVIWYLIDLEDDGNEAKYYDNNNETTLVNGQKFSYKQSSGALYGKNGAMRDFYIKVAQESFWQILPDKRKLHEDGIKLDKLELYTNTGKMDYYQKEKQFYLSSTLLFLLDEYMNEGYFIYPEQFTKPVYANGKTMKLQSLIDEKLKVIPEVDEYYSTNDTSKDAKPGEPTGKKIKSVGNLGLASIILYKDDKVVRTVEGKVTKREEYHESCECVEPVEVNESFSYELPGSPEDIILVEKASTIDGLFEYTYERQKEKGEPLSGTSTDRASMSATILIDTVPEYIKEEVTEAVLDSDGNPTYDEDGNAITTTRTERVKTGRMLDVYEYRTGNEYTEKPVEIEEKRQEDMEFNYLDQYLLNYEAVVPKSVMKGFDFEERMDGLYNGAAGSTIASLLGNTDLEVGSKINTQFFKENYAKYFAIFQKYTAIYGGDPYLMLAKMMLESGGNPNLNADGLMQIVGDSREVTAVRLDGTTETMRITVPEKKDPDKAIKFAVMFNKTKLDKFDGNALKALQAYNFDVSGVFKDKWPDLWATDSDWIDFNKIEEARKILAAREGYAGYKSANTSCGITSTGSGLYGNTCYIPMVLQYYAGSSLNLANTTAGNDVTSSSATKTSLAGGDASKNTFDKTVSTKSSSSASANAKSVVNPDSYLVVVNKDNKLTSSYTPSDLKVVTGVTTKTSKIEMRSEAASAVQDMLKAAKKDGVELGVFSGYRSYADQEAAFKKHNDETISAKAGYSEHQTGLAADIVAKADINKDSSKVLVTSFGDTKEGKWLKNNAYKYGFIIRYLKGKEGVTGYSYEPWHVRYVGLANAKTISDRSLTLEEAINQNLLQGQSIDGTKPLADSGNETGNGGGNGTEDDFDTKFDKEEEEGGFLKKLLSVILGNDYKEEKYFFNYKNHISYKEVRDIKTEFVSYQRKEPYSLVDVDDESLKFVGTLDALSVSGSSIGGSAVGADISPAMISTDGFSSPLNIPNARSKVTSKFGWRDIGDGPEHHDGLDFGVPTGTPIYAVAPGTVSYVEPYKGEGNIYTWGWGSVIWVDHADGVRSIYAHLSKTLVNKGDTVTNGTQLGLTGHTGRSTGPHLHFEMRKNNKPFNPINIALIGY